jgi:response regulator RpfG family c-di-GMP phosphodiesterase
MILLRNEATDEARLSFIGALSGSAAVSLENKELIKAQKMLFEAFIKLIAGAIDAKSPYTGGHCARVPELTKMLARAACAESSGPYKDFALGEEEWEAVHVAAWLHDCGKVTTPEYVVDKATKLETLYDRIHEVRMRFEVLKRDAEIASLKAIADGKPRAVAQEELGAALRQIDDDYAFIAICNEGGEFMAPEKQERLATIAAQTWVRTLNDRIGISHEEKERKERLPAPELPIAETLLADRPDHLFERRPQDRMPADNPWGFRMPVPELLYNKGELYNLSVARGTLAEEERYKINEHIVQTLIMLSQLPFPKHLRNVPEIAAGHHEKMDGTGYPRRLTRDEMSPLARMMAIADIFEALTAVDRPYKKGKKTVGGDQDHVLHENGQAHRPRSVRSLSTRGRLPRVRRTLHAAGIDRRSGYQRLCNSTVKKLMVHRSKLGYTEVAG